MAFLVSVKVGNSFPFQNVTQHLELGDGLIMDDRYNFPSNYRQQLVSLEQEWSLRFLLNFMPCRQFFVCTRKIYFLSHFGPHADPATSAKTTQHTSRVKESTKTTDYECSQHAF